MKDDVIYRQDAIEAIHKEARLAGGSVVIQYADMFQEALLSLPSAQQEEFEWCTDCKEYDHDKHCCPRFNKVIRRMVEELKDGDLND